MRLSRRGLGALVCAASLGLALPSAADDYSNRVGITLGGGAYKLAGGGKDFSKVGPWAQTGLRWGWKTHWDVEATYRYGYNWDTSQNFRCTTTGLDLGALWSIKPDDRWSLQGFGGSGVLWFNVDDFRGKPSPGLFDSGEQTFGYREDGNPTVLNNSNYKVYAGLGGEYYLTHRLSVRGLVRFDYLIKQPIDNTGASAKPDFPDTTQASIDLAKSNVDANDLMPAFAVTFTWFFGERDADQDGIANAVDKCPHEAEDRDGFQDEDGCIDPDNDADGVIDTADNCADTPQGVQVDEKGCPKDSDADGVPDGPDQCPGTPAGAKVDSTGCPTDSDGDAVPDGVDKCDGTPKGIPVDSTGCPMVMHIDKERVLTGVAFQGTTATLLPSSYGTLDSLALAIRAYPGVDLEVQGHVAPNASNTKTPAKVKENDQKLSQQRAEAVVVYLTSKGVDPSRLSPVGYGSEKPLESGDLTVADRHNRITIAPMQAPSIEPVEPVPPKKE